MKINMKNLSRILVSEAKVSAKGQQGFSILEALIAFALVAGVGLTLATIQQQSSNALRAANIQQTAQELKAKMLQAVADQKSWEATYNANVNSNAVGDPLNCIKNQTSCTAYAAQTEFTLFDSTGAILFQNYTNGAAGQPGFDAKGTACATFNDNPPGDANCVFGVKVRRTILCVGTCRNPQLQIDIDLAYRPLNNAPLAVLNTEKYSVKGFLRGAKSLTKSFSLEHQIAAALNVGGGACVGTVPRPWTVAATINPFNLVTAAAGGDITFADGGTYKCRATGTGFGVDAFSINLKNVSTGTLLGSGSGLAPQSAPNWLQSTATLDATFSVISGNIVRLEQVCQNGAAALGYALGVAVNSSYGTQQTLATLICTKLN